MRLESIQAITKSYETGDCPVLVLASDRQYWICKYARTPSGAAHKLGTEWIVSRFLQCFEIPTPATAFVQIMPQDILPEHIANFPYLKPRFFSRPCLGSLFEKNTIELNQFQTIIKPNNRLVIIQELLKIALFDIWIANEDRTAHNPNLLIQTQSVNKMRLFAIDHGAAFNSGFAFSNSGHPLTLLTEEESILKHDLLRALWQKHPKQEKITNFISFLNTELLDWIQVSINNCRTETAAILDALPESWELNAAEIAEWLEDCVYTSKWIDSVHKTFCEYCQKVLF